MLELSAKSEAQAASVNAANHAIDDHANRLDTLWWLLVRLDKTVGLTTTDVQTNHKNIKETLNNNDTKLKKDLSEFESTVTPTRRPFLSSGTR